MRIPLNPDYDRFEAYRYWRISIPYTQAKLRSYPGIMGEQKLALTTPTEFHVLRIVWPEQLRRIQNGID